MFSVIVPTMWFAHQLSFMLQPTLENQDVGEVILIDNNSSIRPTEFVNRFLNHPKLKYIDEGTNLYVNPSWNLGVQCAQFDQICLLSDDIVFDPGLFSQLGPVCNENIGIVGTGYFTVRNGQERIRCGLKHSLVPINSNIPILCWGCAMFMHRTSYTPIPDTFKIFYGDLWLYFWNKRLGRENFYLGGIETQMRLGRTSKDIRFKGIGDWEHDIAEKVFRDEFGEGEYKADVAIGELNELIREGQRWAIP